MQPQPPYWDQYRIDKLPRKSPLDDVASQTRVCNAVREFARREQGAFKAVIFSSLYWDMMASFPRRNPRCPREWAQLHSNATSTACVFQATPHNLTTYFVSLNDRISDIELCKPRSVELLLHTVPASPHGGPAMVQLNALIVHAAASRRLRCLDYDRLVWSNLLVPGRVAACQGGCERNSPKGGSPFREIQGHGAHPLPEYTVPFARYVVDTVLGRNVSMLPPMSA